MFDGFIVFSYILGALILYNMYRLIALRNVRTATLVGTKALKYNQKINKRQLDIDGRLDLYSKLGKLTGLVAGSPIYDNLQNNIARLGITHKSNKNDDVQILYTTYQFVGSLVYSALRLVLAGIITFVLSLVVSPTVIFFGSKLVTLFQVSTLVLFILGGYKYFGGLSTIARRAKQENKLIEDSFLDLYLIIYGSLQTSTGIQKLNETLHDYLNYTDENEANGALLRFVSKLLKELNTELPVVALTHMKNMYSDSAVILNFFSILDAKLKGNDVNLRMLTFQQELAVKRKLKVETIVTNRGLEADTIINIMYLFAYQLLFLLGFDNLKLVFEAFNMLRN